MNRSHADGAAVLLVGAVLLAGGVATWQAYRQWIALDEVGGHMGSAARVMHGTHPLWYLLGTILVVGLVAGGYLAIRDHLVSSGSEATSAESVAARAVVTDETGGSEGRTVDATSEGEAHTETEQEVSTEGTTHTNQSATDRETADRTDPGEAETHPSRPVLDFLPEDERRILRPVVESPGITQIELRDRSAFSKSKVSQTVTDLEKRGLLYRERQGRTYRVYPAAELGDQRNGSTVTDDG